MNSNVLRTCFATAMVLMFCTFAFAQAPTASIKVEGYSPQEIHDLGWASPRSTGLSVVGVNQLVYLKGSASTGVVTSYAWTLTAKPGGSAAVLDSAATAQTTFKPDVTGKYTVSLVVTTSGGSSAPVTVTITAGKFVGSGGVVSNIPKPGQCFLCHNANFTAWGKTDHSTFFTRAIDGTVSDHYSEACIECHTTGHDLAADGNDGFDDVQKALGWTFPAVLQPGNWDSLKVKYPTLAERANIQCESCHGPGSLHNGDKTSIAMSLDEAACGYCHEEAPYHRIDTQWKNSVHGIPNPTFEGVANRPPSSGCNKCHSGWGFIRRIDPKTPDNRPETGFSQISCAVCHDPHRSQLLPSQVRSLDDVQLGDTLTVVKYGGMGKVCMQCHISRRDAKDYVQNPSNLSTHFGPHYSNQADMLDGSNAIDYGVPIGSSGHKFAVVDACVTCHMQPTPAAPSPARDRVGEHTYAMSWDGGTPADPLDDVQHVAICQTCHGPIKSFDDILAKADYDEDGSIESTRHEIEGLLHRLDDLLPPNATTADVNANYKWTASDPPEKIAARQLLAKAWYNFRFVEEDRSMGVHNAGYSIALLRRSIATLTTGDIGAGDIISITDIPNDQGKQVRVAWSKFAADGFASNPVTGYALWRRVDDAPGANAVLVNSKEALIAQGVANNVGKRYSVASSSTWDFVAWIPASGYEVYSMVAPTLYDSTASAGIHWSVFYVSGLATGQIYETAADSGYSIDNLAPFAPGNVAANIAAGKVNLKWDDPIDADFQYFAIYRGTTSGFDPKTTTPLAKLTSTEYLDGDVTLGTTYYYRLSAFDFSGNESAYTPELPLTVTSVNQNVALPTVYALEQNYPNPFNPETAIRYQLAKSGHVKVSIYTSLGQEVRRLVDRNQSAAYHVVVWDGRDDAGNTLPSGVYFYRLESGSFTAMKKMIMMK